MADILGLFKVLNLRIMKKIKVFISGQKYFGQEVLRLCLELDFIEVVGVCAPLDDKYITRIARLHEIPIICAGQLSHENFPDGVDLGITAHSFDYIGKLTRYRPSIGWLGYHPSLLPRHRGKSAIEWALRMRDPITGGSVFWLNGGIDRGDIAYQDWIHVDPNLYSMNPKKASSKLWKDYLLDMGLNLFKRALNDISKGIYIKTPQDDRYSTFEPSTDVKDIFKPDLLMLNA
jgi:methionyl-tRNA formyltransferase